MYEDEANDQNHLENPEDSFIELELPEKAILGIEF